MDLFDHPLSRHFSWTEAMHSDTARRLGIRNTIPEHLIGNVVDTAIQMEMVRSVLGGAVLVSSWYRCPQLNTAVGGSKTSFHMKGLAVDFKPTTVGMKVAFELLAKSDVKFDQLIQEGTKSGASWIHIGFAEQGHKPRRDVMRAWGDVLGGKMTFERVSVS